MTARPARLYTISVISCVVRNTHTGTDEYVIKWADEVDGRQYPFTCEAHRLAKPRTLVGPGEANYAVCYRHARNHQAQFRRWCTRKDTVLQSLERIRQLNGKVGGYLNSPRAASAWLLFQESIRRFHRHFSEPRRRFSPLEAYFIFCLLCCFKAFCRIQPYAYGSQEEAYQEPREDTDEHYVLWELATISNCASVLMFRGLDEPWRMELPRRLGFSLRDDAEVEDDLSEDDSEEDESESEEDSD